MFIVRQLCWTFLRAKKGGKFTRKLNTNTVEFHGMKAGCFGKMFENRLITVNQLEQQEISDFCDTTPDRIASFAVLPKTLGGLQ